MPDDGLLGYKVQNLSTEVLEVFSERQAQTPRSAYETDLLEQRGITIRDKPGGMRVPIKLEQGNFAHFYAEQFIPESKLPRGLKPEFKIELANGKIYRPDRVDLVKGIVYEIKPNTAAEVVKGQLKVDNVYLKILDKEHPLPNGRSWQGKVVTYNKEEVARLAKQWGYTLIEQEMTEKSPKQIPRERAVSTDEKATSDMARKNTRGTKPESRSVSKPNEITNVERGLESAERSVVKGGKTVTAGQAKSLVAREGAEKAGRLAAIRGAAKAGGRILLAVIGRFLAIWDILGWIWLVTDILDMINTYIREKAIIEAIEQAMKTHLPGDITAALEKHQDEIARYYANAWLNKRGNNPIFLYLSPGITLIGQESRKNGFKVDVQLRINSLENDLVSVTFIEPNRKEFEPYRSHRFYKLRWSVQQPIYTQFDIYLEFTNFFAEHVVDSWIVHYYPPGRKPPPDIVTKFYSVVQTLAHISATLKYEPWFGWDPAGPRPPSFKAAVRWEALERLSAMIDNKLIPAVSALESRRLIQPADIRLLFFESPMRQELEFSENGSLIPSMRRIAFDMRNFDAKYLDYERFETVYHRAGGQSNRTPIELQEPIDLREYLKPIARYLPEELKPTYPFVFQLPANAKDIGINRIAPEE